MPPLAGKGFVLVKKSLLADGKIGNFSDLQGWRFSVMLPIAVL